MASAHRRRSSAALSEAEFTLSAETCGGVMLTQTGFGRLLLDAGGNLSLETCHEKPATAPTTCDQQGEV